MLYLKVTESAAEWFHINENQNVSAWNTSAIECYSKSWNTLASLLFRKLLQFLVSTSDSAPHSMSIYRSPAICTSPC